MNIKYKILIGIILAGAIVGVIYFFSLTNEISYAASFTKAPGAGTDNPTVGYYGWSTPEYITVEDGTISYCGGYDATGFTHYLVASNFGFSIPSGSTIDGIIVRWKWYKSDGGYGNPATQFVISLVKGGTLQGANKSTYADLNGYPLAFTTFGSSTDLWGLSLTPADVNSSNFGAAIELHLATYYGYLYASVDYMDITVYYTPPATSTSNFFLLF